MKAYHLYARTSSIYASGSSRADRTLSPLKYPRTVAGSAGRAEPRDVSKLGSSRNCGVAVIDGMAEECVLV